MGIVRRIRFSAWFEFRIRAYTSRSPCRRSECFDWPKDGGVYRAHVSSSGACTDCVHPTNLSSVSLNLPVLLWHRAEHRGSGFSTPTCRERLTDVLADA